MQSFCVHSFLSSVWKNKNDLSFKCKISSLYININVHIIAFGTKYKCFITTYWSLYWSLDVGRSREVSSRSLSLLPAPQLHVVGGASRVMGGAALGHNILFTRLHITWRRTSTPTVVQVYRDTSRSRPGGGPPPLQSVYLSPEEAEEVMAPVILFIKPILKVGGQDVH